MIRFIHLSDVHLGAVPDRGCPWSHEREEEIWEHSAGSLWVSARIRWICCL